MIKGKPNLQNRGSSSTDVARRTRSLIAKVIVDFDQIGNVIDYDCMLFLVGLIDHDYSNNRLELTITITPCLLRIGNYAFCTLLLFPMMWTILVNQIRK